MESICLLSKAGFSWDMDRSRENIDLGQSEAFAAQVDPKLLQQMCNTVYLTGLARENLISWCSVVVHFE